MRADSDGPVLDPYPDSARAVLGGMKAALVLPATVLFASMVGFGSLARDNDFGFAPAVISTASVWGLPGQIAMIELHALGAPLIAMALAVAGANARFLPMSISLLPLFRGGLKRWAWCFALAQLISINTWTGLMRRAPTLPAAQRAPYFVGFALLCMASGLLGTAIGFVLAGTLPRLLTLGLVFLNPIYFLMMFASVHQRGGVLAVLIGSALGPTLHLVSPQWGVPLTGLIAGTVAFLIDRKLPRHG